MALLSVDKLITSFSGDQGKVKALNGVSFDLAHGESLGLVGESGSGKSVTSLSITGLLPRPAGQIESGRVIFDGRDVTQLNTKDMQTLRGQGIAMIFQEPMTALNPVQKIGRQLLEVFHLNRKITKSEARKEAIAWLGKVGIASAEQRMDEYPHQLSGGMRQRVMIAMALAARPKLLIADEPTTALDVTIQKQILDLLVQLQEELGMAMLFITHDLGVIAEVCKRVAVMYAGEIVELADKEVIFKKPLHPYTKGLLGAIPRLDSRPKSQLASIEGSVPALGEMPSGCRFANRCFLVSEECTQSSPPDKTKENRMVKCFHSETLGGSM